MYSDCVQSAQNFLDRKPCPLIKHVARLSKAIRAATPYVPRGARWLEVERFSFIVSLSVIISNSKDC